MEISTTPGKCSAVPTSVTGTVVEGKKLGRTLGFPTANLTTGEAQLPPDGVWAVRVLLQDGSRLDGVANFGVRPTVDGTCRSLEVHLFEYAGDVYGEKLEVCFVNHLRPEIKFSSLEALRIQIQRDADEAREVLAKKLSI